MKYKIFYLSDDGLLKSVYDAWDNYDRLFGEYNTVEDAQKAIDEAVRQGRIKGFYQVELLIIPFVLTKP